MDLVPRFDGARNDGCGVYQRRPWLADLSQPGAWRPVACLPAPQVAFRRQTGKNQRPSVFGCSEDVAQLLRLWSRKARSVRLPADSDALGEGEPRLACREIRRVDPRARSGFCSSGCAFLRGRRSRCWGNRRMERELGNWDIIGRFGLLRCHGHLTVLVAALGCDGLIILAQSPGHAGRLEDDRGHHPAGPRAYRHHGPFEGFGAGSCGGDLGLKNQ